MSMVDTIGFSLSLAQSGEEAEEKGLSFQLVPWPPCLSSALYGSPSAVGGGAATCGHGPGRPSV